MKVLTEEQYFKNLKKVLYDALLGDFKDDDDWVAEVDNAFEEAETYSEIIQVWSELGPQCDPEAYPVHWSVNITINKLIEAATGITFNKVN